MIPFSIVTHFKQILPCLPPAGDGALSGELGGRLVPERLLRLIDERPQCRVAISEAPAREPAH